LNLSKWTKNEKDMGFEIRKGPKKNSKTLKQNITCLLPLLLVLSSSLLCFQCSKNIYNPLVYASNGIKIVQLHQRMKKILKNV